MSTLVDSEPRPGREEVAAPLSRLTITVSVVAYLVVFVVALQMGSSSEEALIKGGAAMLTIGLGWIALSIVGHYPDPKRRRSGRLQVGQHVRVRDAGESKGG